MTISLSELRLDFPIFRSNPSLIYLDNAATSQKPQSVIDAISNFYANFNSNIHRGSYKIANLATDRFEKVRVQIKDLLNAQFSEEIIFTSGATMSINLIANSLEKFLKSGDEIIISQLEHHSNFVPWQSLAQRLNLQLKIIPLKASGELDLEVYQTFLSKNTKLVAISEISNTLGVINNLEKIIRLARQTEAMILVDAAQAILSHTLDNSGLNVQKLDCDFYVFSGHKMFAPTGVGILYGKKKWLETLEPTILGGGMVKSVSNNQTILAPLPHKWEGGTPNIASVIGLGAAVDYLQTLGGKSLEFEGKTLSWQNYLKYLAEYTAEQLLSIKNLRILAKDTHKSTIISFKIRSLSSQDLALFLSDYNICVRSGSHCTQPLLRALRVQDLLRVSLCIYNTIEEIDIFVKKLKQAVEILS